MAGGHHHLLYLDRGSPVHRAPAHLKLPALFAFVLVVVATPGAWWPAFGAYAAALVALAAVARVPARHLAPRMLVETPFVVFAVLVPFVAPGEQVQVLGLSLSRPGLADAGELLATATLGVLASLVLASTTTPRELLAGLERLRLPATLLLITSLMLRYVEVVAGDLGRMRTALAARGVDGGSPRHWPTLARCVGALFIRSYERGERVHLAMLSRGYRPGAPDGAGLARATR
ncbi:cobalt ECF transporter T component CbiQ [Nocardioidaceae bacterium]|nr:cobalt ECF transporter T component CbiQ [Nocardioidaceae bacterium]